MGSPPRNQRITTALETAASTIDPEGAGAPRPDDFLNDEQDSGNRRVKSRRKSRCSTYWRQQAQPVARKFQTSSKGGSNSRSHLQGRVFRAERLSAPDRK